MYKEQLRYAYMKILFGIIFISIWNVAFSQSLPELLHSQQISGFVKTEKYEFAPEKSFCFSMLYLNSDSTYTLECGCENHEYGSIGYWSKSRDSIRMKITPSKQLKIIRNVEILDFRKTGQSTIQILDKSGKYVSEFSVKVKGNRGDSMITADLKGNLTINKNKVDSIDILLFKAYTGEKVVLASADLPSSVKIKLDFNTNENLYNSYFEMHYWNYGVPAYSCSKRELVYKSQKFELVK
jgi:hypothetical protein